MKYESVTDIVFNLATLYGKCYSKIQFNKYDSRDMNQ